MSLFDRVMVVLTLLFGFFVGPLFLVLMIAKGAILPALIAGVPLVCLHCMFVSTGVENNDYFWFARGFYD